MAGFRRAIATLAAVSALAVFLSACETPPKRNAFPEITFQHRAPIRLDVADVQIRQSYQPPLIEPHVEQYFPQPPADVALQWGQDRLRAGGADGRVVYDVRDASVVETKLEVEEGISGLLKVQPGARYDATLAVAMTLFRANGERANLEVEVTRSTTVPEDASINERETIWHQMTEKLARDLDRQLDATVREVFNAYVIE